MARFVMRILKALVLAPILAGTLSAMAAEPAYRDDRSTPEAVIQSFYNAINRAEYARAYSYYNNGEGAGAYTAFMAGYVRTRSVAVQTGQPTQEGAAGSTYYTLPVVIDALSTKGKHAYFAGCYTLRLVQPAIQEPPVKPMHIVSGDLKPAKGPALSFAPASCQPK